MAKVSAWESTLLLTIFFHIVRLEYPEQSINVLLNTFSHCTTILSSPSNRAVSHLNWDINAIIIVTRNLTQFLIDDSSHQPTARAAFVRRNAGSKSCWAVLHVLPEGTSRKLDTGVVLKRLEEAVTVKRGYIPQFDVWLTTTPHCTIFTLSNGITNFTRRTTWESSSHWEHIPFGLFPAIRWESKIHSFAHFLTH